MPSVLNGGGGGVREMREAAGYVCSFLASMPVVLRAASLTLRQCQFLMVVVGVSVRSKCEICSFLASMPVVLHTASLALRQCQFSTVGGKGILVSGELGSVDRVERPPCLTV